VPSPKRGEIWLSDLGYLGKPRPSLVMSVSPEGVDCVIWTVVPHTTAVRGSPWEVAVRKKFLQEGAFLVQGLTSEEKHGFIRKLGELTAQEMALVEDGVREWLLPR